MSELAIKLCKYFDRIVVLGADGFIGSHLLEAFDLEKGNWCRVIAGCMYRPEGTLGVLPVLTSSFAEVWRGYIPDIQSLINAEGAGRKTLWVNCAALVSVPYGATMPNTYWDVNATAVQRMLCMLPEQDTFVQISTSEVFDGNSNNQPYTIDSPLCPVTAYGASKAAAEMAIRGLRYRLQGRAMFCRLFNTYGPRQYPRAVIPTFIRAALKQKDQPGYVPEFGDSTATRSFLYVDDSVQAILATAWLAACVQYAGNLDVPGMQAAPSSGPITIRKLWEIVSNFVGAPGSAPAIWREAARSKANGTEVKHLAGVSSLPQDLWRQTTMLADGLPKTIKWFQQNKDFCSAEDYQ